MSIQQFIRLSLVILAISPAPAGAHFLWIASGEQAKDGKVHVYFSEATEPDDPDLLNKVIDLKLWQSSGEGLISQLKTSKDADSIVAEPIQGTNPLFGLSYDYGVMTRGNDTFLLKYHAKSQPSPEPDKWRAIADAQRLPLELVAQLKDGRTILTVLWQGKPLAQSTVTVTGPGIDKKREEATNEKGEVSFELKSPGLYSIRAKHTEATKGEFEGKPYSSIRHYSTLALSQGTPAAPATPSTSSPAALPPLDPGITSFGAAIVGDDIYLYGGHFGKPHHYSQEGQSDQLLKLNLKSPGTWEVVSKGPRRTGLAAVAHQGKFYRVGGFEARNQEEEKQSLWSMPDFARFDPVSGQWQDLPPMPSGRSSHDAVVIGDILYVVGGWELRGDGEAKWHDTAYSVDLSRPDPVWNELPKPPFLRRALSLGEWHGKVVAIGGMQSEGGVTTATAIFDPKSNTWSDGPKLNGEPMEGFGSSAMLCNNKLGVTTFAGNIQVLADDGSRWINTGKMTHPRFFHRMLTWDGHDALIVGGASMKAGKIRDIETVSLTTGSAGD